MGNVKDSGSQNPHRPEGRSLRSGRALPTSCVFLPLPESNTIRTLRTGETMSRPVAAFCEPRGMRPEHAGRGSHRGRFKVRRRRRACDERIDSRKPESASLIGCRPVKPSATPSSSSQVKPMIRTPIGKMSAKNVSLRPDNTDGVSGAMRFQNVFQKGVTGSLQPVRN